MNFLSVCYADNIEAGRRQRDLRRPRVIGDDKNIKFDERHLAELVRQNMRANNVYVPSGYRYTVCSLHMNRQALAHMHSGRFHRQKWARSGMKHNTFVLFSQSVKQNRF